MTTPITTPRTISLPTVIGAWHVVSGYMMMSTTLPTSEQPPVCRRPQRPQRYIIVDGEQ